MQLQCSLYGAYSSKQLLGTVAAFCLLLKMFSACSTLPTLPSSTQLVLLLFFRSLQASYLASLGVIAVALQEPSRPHRQRVGLQPHELHGAHEQIWLTRQRPGAGCSGVQGDGPHVSCLVLLRRASTTCFSCADVVCLHFTVVQTLHA